jgi:hypothetical protein
MNIDLITNVQKCFTRHIFRKCGLEYVSYVDHLIFFNREPLEIVVTVAHSCYNGCCVDMYRLTFYCILGQRH